MRKTVKKEDATIDFSKKYSKKRKTPKTVKQENDIVVGKIICWGFIIAVPLILLAFLIVSKANESPVFSNYATLSIFIPCIAFGTYNLLGLIFKWNHARACAQTFLHKRMMVDVRDKMSDEEKRETLFLVIALYAIGFLGTAFQFIDIL